MSEIIDQGAALPTPDFSVPSTSSTETIPSSGDDRLSISEAARAVSGYREKRDGLTEPAAPDTEVEASPDEGLDASESEVTENESQLVDDSTAIEPPRSWSKEEKERFNSLPRETQEYLTRRENERDTALRRGQNEAATLRQNLEAREKAVEQMRQQYEQVLPALVQQLQQQQMGEFADIRTQADVDKMANEDWARFARWQNHNMKMQNLNTQIQQNYQRQQQEYSTKWNQFAQNEDNLFAAQATEMNDPAQAKEIATKAVTLLRDTGFSDDDLSKLWSGQASVSLRDHRMQLIIRDAARYRAAKAGVTTKKAALPPGRTLKPGSPSERATESQVNLDSLNKQLDARNTGLAGLRNAAELLQARRAGRRR